MKTPQTQTEAREMWDELSNRCEMCRLHEHREAQQRTEIAGLRESIRLEKESTAQAGKRLSWLYLALFACVLVIAYLVCHG